MSAYDDAVGAWFGALRRGDARTWAQWLGTHPDIEPAPARTAGSALQLEVARRVAAGGAIPGLDALVDTIAATPAFGRGLGDVPMPWPGAHPFGPPPCDPEMLPAEQLLRVAVPVLVRLGARLPAALPVAGPRAGHWWRRGFAVSGPPTYAAAISEDLRVAGLRVGGHGLTGIVVAAPFERAMFALWSRRVASGGAIGWRRFWMIRSRQDQLPFGVDVAAQIERLAGRTRALHVVVGESSTTIAQRIARITGVPVSNPVEESWRRVDLHRRINRVASVGGEAIGARVLALLPPEATRVPGAPRACRPWAGSNGRLQVAAIRAAATAGGYPVHGNPAELLGASDMGAERPMVTTADATLDLAVHAIREAWQRVGGVDD